jgi:hypothetical protein
MRSRLWRAAAIFAPALLSASLAVAGSATAATGGPGLVTSNYACSNGVCEVGPGDTGIAFGAALIGSGELPAISGCTYTMSVTSGSLPPGLSLSGPTAFGQDCNNVISGTPTTAGTYPFTVKVQAQGNGSGTPGPSSTQQLTITVGTGRSDRLANVSAGYNVHTNTLFVGFYDANIGALYSVTVTKPGKQVFAPQSLVLGAGGLRSKGVAPCGLGCTLTVTSSLGSSATVPLVFKY